MTDQPMHEFAAGHDCDFCGHDMLVRTTAAQDPGGPGVASDGDPVVCHHCGAVAMVSCDGEMEFFEVVFDHCDPHNRAIYQRRKDDGLWMTRHRLR